MLSDTDVEDHYHPSVRLLDIERNGSSSCGFHLTRGKWDPYPWVSGVDSGTAADTAGLKPGDCVLEVNGEDIVGQRISEVAEIVKSKPDQVSLLLWNAGIDPQCSPEALCCGPMPTNLQRLSACMSSILAFLECPVCLDTIVPPTYQCDNGHLTCIRCRAKSERCPICRLRFNRGRSLLADQIYNALIDAFNLREETEETRVSKMQQIFRLKNKQKNVPDIKITQSHTNKFLERVRGKSSSVDSLSPNSKYLTPSYTSGENEFNGDLKTKSLSSNEIFHSDSSIVTRCGSLGKLNRSGKYRHLYLQSKTRPASYHGSFETLDRKMDCSFNSLVSLPIIDDGLLFHCPFDSKCSTLLKGGNIMEHFQLTHDGPLTQYFTTNIRVPLRRVVDDKEICYVIHYDSSVFFLKMNVGAGAEDNSTLDDILIWMWYLGKHKTSCEYQLKIVIRNSETNAVLLSVISAIISLSCASSQDIKESKKGVFLNAKTLEAFNQTTSNVIFDMEIVKCDC